MTRIVVVRAPQARVARRRGGEGGERVTHPNLGGDCAPTQEHFSILDLKSASFGAFWALFLKNSEGDFCRKILPALITVSLPRN